MNVTVIATMNGVTLVKFNEERVCPYAVVRNFDSSDNTWSHAIEYCRDVKQAKKVYLEKIEGE